MKLVGEISTYTKRFETPIFDTKIWKCEKCNLFTMQDNDSSTLIPYLGKD